MSVKVKYGGEMSVEVTARTEMRCSEQGIGVAPLRAVDSVTTGNHRRATRALPHGGSVDPGVWSPAKQNSRLPQR